MTLISGSEHHTMRQKAPYPQILAGLVDRLEYKAGWKIWLENMDRGQDSKGLTLVIQRYGPDTYHPDRMMRVNHYMPVPPAAFNLRSWQRWLFDQFLLVERHEACEFFVLHDSPGSEHVTRPYAPHHGPGNDPYVVWEHGELADAETSFLGARDEGSQAPAGGGV